MRIFLTYRRDDSAGQTGRIADRLRHEFGEDSLFMDVDDIPLGVDFKKRINDEVARCDVLLAAIGSRWVGLTDETGERRIDNPSDYVRIEIGAALRRDIPVIPILLDGTKIPSAQLLPDDVKAISDRNALEVRHSTFHSDLIRLIERLKQISPSCEPKVSEVRNEQLERIEHDGIGHSDDHQGKRTGGSRKWLILSAIGVVIACSIYLVVRAVPTDTGSPAENLPASSTDSLSSLSGCNSYQTTKSANGKNVGLLIADYPNGINSAQSAEILLRQKGYRVVTKVMMPLHTLDYSSFLLQMTSAGADIIVNCGPAESNFLKQAKEFGAIPN